MRSCCAVFAGVRAARELRRSVQPVFDEEPGFDHLGSRPGPLTHRRSTRAPTSLRAHHDADRGPDALRAPVWRQPRGWRAGATYPQSHRWTGQQAC
jgi:hypothetical protein